MKKPKAGSATRNRPEIATGERLANSYYKELELNSLQEALRPFGVTLTPPLAESLRRYVTLLLRWNQKINLTATSDVGELLSRHVGESLFGASLLPGTPGTLCDIGSGAGFPGLMLKLARPEWQLLFVESDHRKSAFLSEAVRTLNLSGTRVLSERYDRLPTEAPLADVITARALGEYERLLAWSKKSLRPDGRVILWLGSSDADKLARIPGWRFDPPVPIPESRQRVVLSASLDF